MKVNVFRILVDHLLTLRNAGSGRISWSDIILFFGLPALLAALPFWRDYEFKAEFFNVSITFFGIFVGLLLNIQVAIFSIFLRKREPSLDKRSDENQINKMNQRNILLQELNSNVSYMIVLSCFSLLFFLSIFASSYINSVLSAICVMIYSHFMLTLLMVVKRSYALFKSEYAN